ncbi:hypothetical protein [Streptomyces sp. NPDC059631]|uniref:hypothetical protein n=1 Tax=unclassified Streptomyces TaxID=2593676 RepID=UPI0036B566C2
MTKHRIARPRTPAPDEPRPTPSEPAGLTTFSAALTLWTDTLSQPADPSPAHTPAPVPPGPRLLHDQGLPTPPPGLPSLPELQKIAHTAADRAHRVLGGTPLPVTALADAIHIADAASITDPTPAYRLDVDLGHWRELLTRHHVQGCAAEDTAPGHEPPGSRSCQR